MPIKDATIVPIAGPIRGRSFTERQEIRILRIPIKIPRLVKVLVRDKVLNET